MKSVLPTPGAIDARKAALEADYDEWLTNAHEQAKESTSWSGAWYSAGPFTFTGDAAKQTFDPEKNPVKLSDSFDDGRIDWRRRFDYRDAMSNQFVDGSMNAVNYLFRRIVSPQDYTLNISLRAGNGAVIWLNDKPITPTPHNGNGPIVEELIRR